MIFNSLLVLEVKITMPKHATWKFDDSGVERSRFSSSHLDSVVLRESWYDRLPHSTYV